MQLGDVVELGRHRLMCGDAFNPEHVDLLMQGEKPDLLYNDPPYGMNLETTRAQATVDRQWKATAETFASRRPRDYPAVIGDSIPFDPSPIFDRFRTVKEQFWWGADYFGPGYPMAAHGLFGISDSLNHSTVALDHASSCAGVECLINAR